MFLMINWYMPGLKTYAKIKNNFKLTISDKYDKLSVLYS